YSRSHCPCIVRWLETSRRRRRLAAREKRSRSLNRSISRPDARRNQFQQVSIRIAKIKTSAAAFPLHYAFNRNSLRAKPFFPRTPFRGRNRECRVAAAFAIEAGNPSSRKRHVFPRLATLEKQQDLPAADIQRSQAFWLS